MTQDETIELARQAGFRVGPSRDGPDDVWGVGANLERFAKLVRNHYSYTHAHLWLTRIEGAVKAEREACADTARLALQHIHKAGEIAESAIRARGQL